MVAAAGLPAMREGTEDSTTPGLRPAAAKPTCCVCDAPLPPLLRHNPVPQVTFDSCEAADSNPICVVTAGCQAKMSGSSRVVNNKGLFAGFLGIGAVWGACPRHVATTPCDLGCIHI